MKNVGLMQGRLTPSLGRGIQFFPFDNWDKEFAVAGEIGISDINFIFDFQDYEKNPLWSDEGVKKIVELIKSTGVRVRHINADFFMRRPFHRVESDEAQQNLNVFEQLAKSANAIGAQFIEIPVLDNSSIKSDEEKTLFTEYLNKIIDIGERVGIRVSVETDWSPNQYEEILPNFGGRIYAVYDIGNSASLGYDPDKELDVLLPFLSNVHIKDRKLSSSTVKLGTGDAKFDLIFERLRGGKYAGGYTLQVARGEDGDEKNEIKRQLDFISQYINF